MSAGVRVKVLRRAHLAAWLALIILPALADAAGQQDKIAKAYLQAAASGQPEALLEFLHPGELEDLRKRLIAVLENEAAHGSSTVRERLFGTTTAEEIRRLTPSSLFVTLARRVGLPTEKIGEIKILGVIDENSQLSHVVARIVPPEDSDIRGRVALVSLVRYGKEWRVAIPDAFQVRLDAALVVSEGGASAGKKTPNTPEILEFLENASTALRNGDCAGFFNERMSPNFRASTSPKALKTLIDQCMTYEETRETYISALELARRMAPAYEQNGARAIYDLRGQGLPFDRFVLEKVDGRWYVAE